MRDFVSRIPRPAPKSEPPNPSCMTLAVWQPPPIAAIPISPPILQQANSAPLQSRPRSPENFVISERGDNLSPERMDIDWIFKISPEFISDAKRFASRFCRNSFQQLLCHFSKKGPFQIIWQNKFSDKMTNDITEDVQIQALRFYDKIRNLDTNQYDILKGVALGYCLGRVRYFLLFINCIDCSSELFRLYSAWAPESWRIRASRFRIFEKASTSCSKRRNELQNSYFWLIFTALNFFILTCKSPKHEIETF